MEELVLVTKSYQETMLLGEKIARTVPNGTTLLLFGDLGAGKTTLVRGVARGLNITEVIQSPTFNIMKIYLKGDRPLIHIDAYRLADINTDIGLDEYIGYETGITVIEWPMFIENLLPKDSFKVTLERTGDEERKITIEAPKEVLEGLR